jgi:myo-inositol-1(or 4)-monophosphatase
MSTKQPVDHPFLAVAMEAVLKAGELQMRHLGTDMRVSVKEGTDIVTEVDLEVEAVVRALIAERFPGHGILAEETAERLPSEGDAHRWLLDPIDGTVNYAHGLGIFCASLALEVNHTLEVAAVYDPSRRELFSAARGLGAWLNGLPIAVSRVSQIRDATIGVGFPHGATTRNRVMEDMFCEAAVQARGIRRLGSAALDLCNVACGRLDGFWDMNLKPWDLAAGALLVQEAGGTVTALHGTPFSCHSGNVLASNGQVHEDLQRIVLAAN